MKTEFKEIAVNSPLYEAAIALRVEVLRGPTGRGFTHADRENDSKGSHFVAVAAGYVIACVGFYPQTDGSVLLPHLAVSPGHRRQGVGRDLLEFAERRLREGGVTRIEAEARVDAQDFTAPVGLSR